MFLQFRETSNKFLLTKSTVHFMAVSLDRYYPTLKKWIFLPLFIVFLFIDFCFLGGGAVTVSDSSSDVLRSDSFLESNRTSWKLLFLSRDSSGSEFSPVVLH